MKDLIVFGAGVFVGIVLATVGFAGVLRIADKGIEKVKERSAELSR